MSPELELHEFSVGRRGRPLFAPICLVAGTGQTVVLRGPNGIGKSTLLLALAGSHPQHRGELRRLACVPSLKMQNPSLFPSLTVEESLSLTKGSTADRIAFAVALFRLETLLLKPTALLSGGEVQRVGLALALAREHNLLLLDEPFEALDSESASDLARHLRDTAGSRITLVAHHGSLTHDLSPLKEVQLASP